MYMDYVLRSREYRFQPPNQARPTLARPGSTEKLRVMTERCRAGQPLHHPGDAKCLNDVQSAINYLRIVQQRSSRL